MMKNYFKIFSLLVVLFLPLLFVHPASAKTVIADGAALFSSEEINTIEASCDSIEQRYATSVYIVTSDKIGENNNYESYMDSIGNDENAPKNLVLLFISMKENQRVYNIFGYGKAEKMLTNSRLNKILDAMYADIKGGAYYEAIDTFCDETMTYMGRNPMLDSFIFSSVVQLILCLLIACGIVIFLLRRGIGKNTTTVNTYLDNQNIKILGQIDHYTHMTMTRAKKPKSSSSSHSRSSGGRSHSRGSGRSF